MNRSTVYLSVIGLGIGALFGMTGSFVPNPQLQIGLYEISSVGLTVACILLGLKFFKENEELVAGGFLLFGIGEAVMSSGTTLGEVGGQAAFGAGIALYVPALLLICIPKLFPIWLRGLGVLASIPFLIASVYIFMGEPVYSSSNITGAGYGLLSLTIIGWMYVLWRSSVQVEKNAGEELQIAGLSS